MERFLTLHLHTYRKSFIPRLGLMEWHFNSLVNVNNHIEIFKLTRPTIGFTAHDLVSVVLSSVNDEQNQ